MAVLPHDITDLRLAPVVLAIDARIEELSQLKADDLAMTIALYSNRSDLTPQQRQEALLEAAGHLIDTYEWELSLDTRGIRLTHGEHTLVLGIPVSLSDYLAGS